jgi:putative ABC transport system permease protein
MVTGLQTGLRSPFFICLPSGIPFAYSFLDDDEARQYALEERWGRIINYASIFAILIACSGLFGLTLQAMARRTKEIGIRKVMGASVWQITRLVNREFLSLVLLANLEAWPAGYFAMQALRAARANPIESPRYE